MDIHLYVHQDGQDEINRKLDWLIKVQHEQGVKLMANFDALNARLAELQATEATVLAKIDELRAILESDSEDQAKVDAALVVVGEVEDALQAKVEEKNP